MIDLSSVNFDGRITDLIPFCFMRTSKAVNLAGDASSKSVLDAFFLGKALAEALNERIESAVGEFLSIVGRFQAEQQKQVQDFQVPSS